MPGYDTHYIFGMHALNKMPDADLKNTIKKHKQAYHLGLLGPDIFFFYATEIVAPRKNLGSIMHTENTDVFFKNCIEFVINERGYVKDICTSYLCGFLSHYILDVNIHPYVYWMSDYAENGKDSHDKHFSLETDIDICLITQYLHTTHERLTEAATISIPDFEKLVISNMLYYAIRNTYDESRITRKGIQMAIFSVQKEYRMLKLLSKTMKSALGTLEHSVYGKRFIAPLIPFTDNLINKDPLNLKHNLWKNPWNESITSTKSIPQLLKKSREDLIVLYVLLDNFLVDSNDNLALNVLMRCIGNKSYHSGLSCNSHK